MFNRPSVTFLVCCSSDFEQLRVKVNSNPQKNVKQEKLHPADWGNIQYQPPGRVRIVKIRFVKINLTYNLTTDTDLRGDRKLAAWSKTS